MRLPHPLLNRGHPQRRFPEFFQRHAPTIKSARFTYPSYTQPAPNTSLNQHPR